MNKSLAENYGAATPNGNNTGGAAPYNFDVVKQIKAHAAFSIGINIKKPLSAKSSIITGLQFTSYHTIIETGSNVDTTALFYYNNTSVATLADNYYRPLITNQGSKNLYKNKYAFLEIPVIYERRITTAKRFSFNWNAGLSITQLLKSNSLIFDYYNQSFYANNDFLRKTQVYFKGSLTVEASLNKVASVSIGPQFSYGLSNLLKNKTYGNQHLISYGLKANIFLKK